LAPRAEALRNKIESGSKVRTEAKNQEIPLKHNKASSILPELNNLVAFPARTARPHASNAAPVSSTPIGRLQMKRLLFTTPTTPAYNNENKKVFKLI
jgi:hypothetical protein